MNKREFRQGIMVDLTVIGHKLAQIVDDESAEEIMTALDDMKQWLTFQNMKESVQESFASKVKNQSEDTGIVERVEVLEKGSGLSAALLESIHNRVTSTNDKLASVNDQLKAEVSVLTQAGAVLQSRFDSVAKRLVDLEKREHRNSQQTADNYNQTGDLKSRVSRHSSRLDTVEERVQHALEAIQSR